MADLRHNSKRLRGGLKPSVGVGWMIARRKKAPIRSSREHEALPLAALLGPPVQGAGDIRRRDVGCDVGNGGDDLLSGSGPLFQATGRMLSRDGCEARPVVPGKSQKENLQRQVVGNGGLMSKDVAPCASLDPYPLMVFMASCRRFVRSDPGAERRFVERPFGTRCPTARFLDDEAPEQMRSDSHHSP